MHRPAEPTELLDSFRMEDDLTEKDRGAIEVVVRLKDGRRRWCFFFTPEALKQCGDWIDGTRVHIQYGAPHMIVVSSLDADIIEKALRHIDREGKLVACMMQIPEQRG